MPIKKPVVKKLSTKLLQDIEDNSIQESTLYLSDEPLADDDVKALVNALKYNSTITSLDLANTEISDAACTLLAKIKTIDTLTVSYNNITAEGAMALSRGSFKHLDLSANSIGNQGALAFETSPLVSLNLSGCGLAGDEIAPLFKNPFLKQLNLSLQELTDNSLIFLANNHVLESLELRQNWFTEAGMMYVELNHSLKIINLSVNYLLLDAGIEKCSRNTSIEVLNISGTGVGDRGAMLLALNPYLKKLDISHNALTSEGAISLLKHPTLEFINFAFNPITQDAISFYQSLEKTSLKEVQFPHSLIHRSYSGPT